MDSGSQVLKTALEQRLQWPAMAVVFVQVQCTLSPQGHIYLIPDLDKAIIEPQQAAASVMIREVSLRATN